MMQEFEDLCHQASKITIDDDSDDDDEILVPPPRITHEVISDNNVRYDDDYEESD